MWWSTAGSRKALHSAPARLNVPLTLSRQFKFPSHLPRWEYPLRQKMAESGLSRKVTFLDCKKSHLLVGAHDKSPTIAVSMSIPPHAGGIHHTLAVVLAHAPITPASGGNTPCTCFAKSEPANNPRMRGGIPFFKQPDFRFAPITPACGGNTKRPGAETSNCSDNPRKRGEYPDDIGSHLRYRR